MERLMLALDRLLPEKKVRMKWELVCKQYMKNKK